MKTTNYQNTFIEIAEDCTLNQAEVPPQKTNPTAANIQFDMIFNHPYQYNSDDILFEVYRLKNNLSDNAIATEKTKFFSKGQPCFRASPLTKRYGWGLHSNNEGKVALFALESKEYQNFIANPEITKIKAMRTKKK